MIFEPASRSSWTVLLTTVSGLSLPPATRRSPSSHGLPRIGSEGWVGGSLFLRSSRLLEAHGRQASLALGHELVLDGLRVLHHALELHQQHPGRPAVGDLAAAGRSPRRARRGRAACRFVPRTPRYAVPCDRRWGCRGHKTELRRASSGRQPPKVATLTGKGATGLGRRFEQ